MNWKYFDISSWFKDQSAGLAIPMALLMAISAGASAGVIDVALYLQYRTHAQVQLDAVTLSAAREFIAKADESYDDQRSHLAEHLARLVGTIQFDDRVKSSSPSYSIDMENKTITIAAQAQMDTSILSVLGIKSLPLSVESTAVARVDNQPVCILALDPFASPGIEFSGDGELKAKDCVVWSNSKSMSSLKFDGGGKVSTERLCAVGHADYPGRFKVEPEAEENCNSISDPMATWQPQSYGACTSNSGIDEWIKETTTQLEPGVYCGGLRVDAKNIFLKPGLYVIKNGPLILRGSSKIKGADIGILLSGGDSFVDIDGKAKVELTSAESGDMAGIAIAADRTVTDGKSKISGRSDLKIGGVIYLPKQEIEYWGESDTKAASPVTTLVASTIRIGGDAYLEVKNNKKKAKYAPILSTGGGSVRLLH